MNTKKIKLFSLSLALALLISSCQAGPPDTLDKEDNGDTLRFMLLEEPKELDPTEANESYASPVIYHTFEPLLVIDQNGDLIPAAASSWEVTDNNRTFTFTIRKEAKWSDGTALTAYDFASTYLRILSPESPTQNSGLLSPYILGATEYMAGNLDAADLGIKALDNHTLELKTTSPTPYFLQVLAFSNLSPVRVDIVTENGEQWDQSAQSYIGNGAFYMSTYDFGKKIVLKKNPNYWNADSVRLESIIFSFRQQGQDPIDAFLEDTIDGIYELTANELRIHPELEPDVYTHIAPSTSFIVINHDRLLLKNSDFRRAIEMAIDRKKIVDQVILGAGIPSKYLVPLTYTINAEPFHDFTELDKAPDYQAAKLIIDDLKARNLITDKPLRIFAMDSGPDADVANEIAHDLETKLGLAVEVSTYPWAELFSKSMAGEYDLIMLGFGGDYPHPMTFLSNFIEDGILTDILNWHNPEFDLLLSETLQTTDEKIALEQFRALEAMILDDHHIINLYHRKKVNLMSSRIKGWYRNSISMYVFTHAYIE
ncbi:MULTISPECIES: peptide ABC transporter substrate-binding protein [unclassified Fusibacter]|uniref:peptide ABC transporter substrate-binding protein n=1 Tax=unclassified Fusibacter TaxID=2624464 RepID=UPI0013E924BE|nr:MULTISPECIES: peptide ABC transporter substrate-binding protein [unclassified Fusibacter]MCK8060460.1 peptide ABC transporter substrate-binding protein [Fusibacter sp. A2]NPE20251.1 peptide ABC transporter substrate-binding protein [Fusibacter sp. A1]